ncbi:MAG TPA: glycosyltransferase, partial [bacterium]|nr:glycosyltransferase [bacterium]
SPSVPSWLSRLKPDLVHIHHPYPLGFVSYILAGRSKPLVVTWHSDIVRQKVLKVIFRPVQNAVLRRSNAIIVTSEPLMKQSPDLRKYQTKCLPIPLGVDVGRLDSLRATAAARGSQAAMLQHSPSILFVGRLVRYKGLEVLLRAMVGIQANLFVVGEGILRGSSQRLASELGVADRVIFLGKVPEETLAGLYAGCSVFVLPSVSNNEAFGLVQLEAMAASKPVVSTNLPTGVPYVNRDEVTGYVVPPDNPEALMSALNRLLATPSLALRMGQSGRSRVEQEFRLELMIERTLEVYRRCL